MANPSPTSLTPHSRPNQRLTSERKSPIEGSNTAVTTADWERRKQFVGFTDQDAKLLKELQSIAETYSEEIVDELYEQILHFDEIKAFFPDEATLNRVKGLHREYFLSLTGGEYDQDYLASRLRIGKVHHRIGLSLSWYMGGYSIYLQLLTPHVKTAFGSDSEKGQRALVALLKIITLDQELATATCIAAREAKLERRTADLQRAEEKYRSIFENAGEGIFQTSSDGSRYITANPALARILGYDSPEELIESITNIEHQVYADANRDAESIQFLQKPGVVEGGVNDFEVKFRKKNGGQIDCLVTSSVRYAPDGSTIGHEGIVRDISERKRAGAKVKRQLEQLAAMHAIDKAISSSQDLSATLNIFLDQLVTQLKVGAASVLRLDSHTGELKYTAGRGFRTSIIRETRQRLGEGHAGTTALDRRLRIIPDLTPGDEEFSRTELVREENFAFYVVVPLIAKDEVKAVLEIFHRSPREYDREWLGFLETLAEQAAIALENAELFNNLQRSNTELTLAYDATIEALARSLELRDRETEEHARRVTETTVQLARLMGLEEEELVHVRRGALLHDLGKIAIPDSILLKEGPLTDEEWKTMREHPALAYNLLLPIAYLRPALDIPYCHHEKWDGNGYPRGLKGEQIPLVARIFAVVDVWDALSSNRPYFEAWSSEKILEHIEKNAGTHFDPKVVKVFLEMI